MSQQIVFTGNILWKAIEPNYSQCKDHQSEDCALTMYIKRIG